MTHVQDLPRTSRAAVITAFNEPLEVWDVPLPQELEYGGLIVRIDAATVCGSDVHVWDGSLGGTIRAIELPVIPGHEMVGTIVAMGEEQQVDIAGAPLGLGDLISFTPGRCGTCFHCTVNRTPALCTHRRNYGSNLENYPYLVGGFAEYCYVYPEARRVKVPATVEPEWASASSCALRTVINAFEQLGRIEHWQTVVIQGAGPLGLFATALASVSGAARILTIGDPADRLRLAEDWGATDIVSVAAHPQPADRTEAVRALTGGQGAEIVMEFSGARSAFAEGIAMVRRGGRYLVAGQVGPHEVTFQPTMITRGNVNIIGSFSADETHYWRGLEFMSRHRDRFDFDRILSSRFGLDAVGDALEGMQGLREIKPVIIPSLTA